MSTVDDEVRASQLGNFEARLELYQFCKFLEEE
jgi:hypothetical protein